MGSWNDLFRSSQINVRYFETFKPGRFQATLLRQIKKAGVLVVIVLAYSDDTAKIALNADSLGMTSVGWSWISSAQVVGAEGMLQFQQRKRAKLALHGWLFVHRLSARSDQSVALEQFYEEVKTAANDYFNHNITSVGGHAANLWDAVYLFAHAATRVIAAGGSVNDGIGLVKEMRNISFQGIEQVVVLNEDGDRLESYEVMNYVLGADGAMESVPVGLYNSSERTYSAYGREVIWPGNTTDTPLDRRGAVCVSSRAFIFEVLYIRHVSCKLLLPELAAHSGRWCASITEGIVDRSWQ